MRRWSNDRRNLYWDPVLERATVVDPTGAVRTRSVHTGETGAFTSPFLVGVVGDSSLVLRAETNIIGHRGQPAGVRRDSTCFYRCVASCQRLHCGAGPEVFFRGEGKAWGTTDVIFGADLLAATSRRRVWVADGGTCQIQGLDATGHPRLSITSPGPDVPVDDGAVERERSRALATLPNPPGLPPEVRRQWREQLQATQGRSVLPRCTALTTDTRGRVWVRRATLPDRRTVGGTSTTPMAGRWDRRPSPPSSGSPSSATRSWPGSAATPSASSV